MHDTEHDRQPTTDGVPFSPSTTRGPGLGDLELPSLGRFLRQVRESGTDSRTGRPISRETAAYRVGLSAAYLTQIERDLRTPTPQALQLLTTGYGLTAAQTRHITELRAPPVPAPPIDTMRARVENNPAIRRRLRGLGRAGVLAAYFDPFWNLLAANPEMHQTFPGLEQTGNLALWYFSREARERLPEWDLEAAAVVSALKATLGVHRRAVGARAVLAQLQHDSDFRRLWTHTTDIAYHRDRATPLRIHVAGQVRELDIETSVISDVHSHTRLFQAVTVALTTT
ncbi:MULTISPECIES: helix-turn-helix domain-containing protein [Nocardia]|uniref:helix-turn-helix domain-containing protein n=1 Tax=Nocardia TaxID=1817 RepID=UPI000D690C09|nr:MULTISPECIES: helix-turn-helix domain-containing protein [Nocardia]